MPDLLLWWNAAVPAGMAGLFVLGGLALNYSRLQRWERIAKSQLRDSDVKISVFRIRPRLTARSGPVEVRITDAGGGRTRRVAVEIEGPEGFAALKLRRQLFTPRTREIEIGDPPFDHEFVVEGPALAVGARLDELMRRRLLSAASGCPSLEIGDGRLRAEVAEKDLRRIFPVLLAIGRELAEPVTAERKVSDNALRDRLPGVRIFNLLLLARERPGDPAALAVLREACSDENAEVRLRAAIELGEEGRGVLLKLAEKSVDDGAAAQAVAHLDRTLSFETLQKILSRATAKDLPRTALATVRALGMTGETAAEAALLQALQSEDDGLREAAATALGRVGTAAAVPALQEAADRGWLDRSLRRVARQAIAEIQSRLVGASPGQLSLAGADGKMGRLSLATADAGQLAIVPDAAGQLAVLPHGAESEGSPPDAPQRQGHRER